MKSSVVVSAQTPPELATINLILFILKHISRYMLLWSYLDGLKDERPKANMHPSRLCAKGAKSEYQYLVPLFMEKPLESLVGRLEIQQISLFFSI
jgi:hypothetical protein